MQILETLFWLSAGTGLVLGLTNLLIWIRLRQSRDFLFAGLMSLAAGLGALCELSYLGQPTIASYRAAFLLQAFFIVMTLVSMVWFLHFRLGTGAVWLCWLITAVELAGLTLPVLFKGGLSSDWVSSLDYRTTAWGEAYALPGGALDPWKYIADLGTLLIIIYVILGAIRAFRKGRRSDALFVSAPILFFIVVAGIHTPLVDAGVVQTPYAISLVFVAISLSLAVGLVDRVARGAQANRELEVERSRWRMMLEVIELAVIRIDANGRIAYINPFLERIARRPAFAIEGQDLSVLFPGASLDQRHRLATNPDAWRHEASAARFLPVQGSPVREIDWFGVALTDAAGRSDGLIALGQDITEQRRLEAERDASRRQIDVQSRALTMGELASSIAHELSQPIAAVLTNAQTLELLHRSGQVDEAEIKAILTDIISDTRRARDLMQRVRSFMYSEEPKREWFDPNVALKDVLKWLESEASSHGVSVVNKTYDMPPQVFGAYLELQQVMINLIVNAIQAAGERDDGRVSVEFFGAVDGSIHLVVEDNGPGLADDNPDGLFAPFVSSKSTGTGVGLAIVRRIVERHDAKIKACQSVLGGARFEVVLPEGQVEEIAAYARA